MTRLALRVLLPPDDGSSALNTAISIVGVVVNVTDSISLCYWRSLESYRVHQRMPIINVSLRI